MRSPMAQSFPKPLAVLLILGGVSCTHVENAPQAPPPAVPVTTPVPAPPASPAPAPNPPESRQPAAQPSLPEKEILDNADLTFSPGGWTLTAEGNEAIQRIAGVLRSLGPGFALLVTGYSSSTGTRAQNLKVSRHRADFVAKALSSAGVPRDRITIRSLGSENPIASNATLKGRLKNQRVEVEFQKIQETQP